MMGTPLDAAHHIVNEPLQVYLRAVRVGCNAAGFPLRDFKDVQKLHSGWKLNFDSSELMKCFNDRLQCAQV